ncbi:UNKNOWN [Stylonychia lemnae]|uniref:Uncharacterized protein n=1 Tax=Stylonychia lemnae TaxID=5949 RepID=A0A078BD70_STYLE|nr:UNKNOWN [Stylonychia lemnae]|eukprot:CDW91157.1 UNKNOWN [Stylonychia lemnae]
MDSLMTDHFPQFDSQELEVENRPSLGITPYRRQVSETKFKPMSALLSDPDDKENHCQNKQIQLECSIPLPFNLENLKITDNSPNKLGWFSNKFDSPLQTKISDFSCTKSPGVNSEDSSGEIANAMDLSDIQRRLIAKLKTMKKGLSITTDKDLLLEEMYTIMRILGLELSQKFLFPLLGIMILNSSDEKLAEYTWKTIKTFLQNQIGQTLFQELIRSWIDHKDSIADKTDNSVIRAQYEVLLEFQGIVEFINLDLFEILFEKATNILLDKDTNEDVKRAGFRIFGPFIYYLAKCKPLNSYYKLQCPLYYSALKIVYNYFEDNLVNYQEELAFMFPCLLQELINTKDQSIIMQYFNKLLTECDEQDTKSIIIKFLPELLRISSDNFRIMDSIQYQYSLFINSKVINDEDLYLDFIQIIPEIKIILEKQTSFINIQANLLQIAESKLFKENWRFQEKFYSAIQSVIKSSQSIYQINIKLIDLVNEKMIGLKQQYSAVQSQIIQTFSALVYKQYQQKLGYQHDKSLLFIETKINDMNTYLKIHLQMKLVDYEMWNLTMKSKLISKPITKIIHLKLREQIINGVQQQQNEKIEIQFYEKEEVQDVYLSFLDGKINDFELSCDSKGISNDFSQFDQGLQYMSVESISIRNNPISQDIVHINEFKEEFEIKKDVNISEGELIFQDSKESMRPKFKLDLQINTDMIYIDNTINESSNENLDVLKEVNIENKNLNIKRSLSTNEMFEKKIGKSKGKKGENSSYSALTKAKKQLPAKTISRNASQIHISTPRYQIEYKISNKSGKQVKSRTHQVIDCQKEIPQTPNKLNLIRE